MSTILHSRKFWALVVAIVAAAAALATGQIAELEALRLAVQALMVYIGAVAIEDGLSRRAPSAPPVASGPLARTAARK